MRVLVTGASSGIGRATALMLIRRGDEVLVTGRDRARLEDIDGAARVFTADLSNFSEAEEAVAGLGTLDGMVHCAGISKGLTPLRSVTAGVCEEVMRTNWLSSVAVCKGFRRTRSTGERSHRSVVLISSVSSYGLPGAGVYGASKAAVATLARSLAGELAREGIRVNCVTPGWVRTPMTDAAAATLTDEQIEAIHRMQVLGVGEPEDVAEAAAYLLRARWATGTNLQIDGGWRLA